MASKDELKTLEGLQYCLEQMVVVGEGAEKWAHVVDDDE